MKGRYIWILGILGFGFAFWAILYRGQSELPAKSSPSEIELTSEQEAIGLVVRETLDSAQGPADRLNLPWFQDPQALDAFQEEVRFLLYDEGALEKALLFIDEHSQTPNHERRMNEVQDAASKFKEKGLIPLNPEVFMGALYGADMQVRNRVQAELRNYESWLRDREQEDYSWPEFEIEHDPFRLVPEMLAAYLSGEKMGVTLSDGARMELANLRDQQMLQMLSLEQEMQIRQTSVEAVFREFQKNHGLDDRGGLSDEEILSLYPETAAIVEAQKELRAGYLRSIQNLLISERIPLAEERNP